MNSNAYQIKREKCLQGFVGVGSRYGEKLGVRGVEKQDERKPGKVLEREE